MVRAQTITSPKRPPRPAGLYVTARTVRSWPPVPRRVRCRQAGPVSPTMSDGHVVNAGDDLSAAVGGVHEAGDVGVLRARRIAAPMADRDRRSPLRQPLPDVAQRRARLAWAADHTRQARAATDADVQMPGWSPGRRRIRDER